jgi:uncharacterized membrane protein YvbJ
MFCTNCGEKIPEGAAQCPKCGMAVNQANNEPGEVTPEETKETPITITLPPVKLPSKGQFMRFLSFDAMITPTIMKAVYVIGSVIIFIIMLVGMFQGGAGMFFLSLLMGIIGLVFFRILCEQMILFFSIHSKLTEIRDKE